MCYLWAQYALDCLIVSLLFVHQPSLLFLSASVSPFILPSVSVRAYCPHGPGSPGGDSGGLGRGASAAGTVLHVWLHALLDSRRGCHVCHLPADAAAHGREPRADRSVVPANAAGRPRVGRPSCCARIYWGISATCMKSFEISGAATWPTTFSIENRTSRCRSRTMGISVSSPWSGDQGRLRRTPSSRWWPTPGETGGCTPVSTGSAYDSGGRMPLRARAAP